MNESFAPRARLLTPKETTGEMWWGHFLGAHINEINKRFQQAPTVYWSPSERMPLDLFSYSREAGLCFTIARYLATIVLSSVLVEIVLNRDRRTAKETALRRIGGWATLNNKNLKVASNQGLPVHMLISTGESLDDKHPIRFVERRNKVAHGGNHGHV